MTRQLEGRANKRKKEAEDPIAEAMFEVQSARKETVFKPDEIMGFMPQKTSTELTNVQTQFVCAPHGCNAMAQAYPSPIRQLFNESHLPLQTSTLIPTKIQIGIFSEPKLQTQANKKFK